ncbi:MAG: cysteine dioxygenase family protein [SAR324 cluster bacterium]|nr:cysteine dioxygenase family protein [SAR324 cluster bacterium]MCZ6532155.1 cysteine dioxygenase family protein [SAR324 cluster bacterium]
MEQAVQLPVNGLPAYGLEDYVADLRAIKAETDDPPRVIERVRPLAQLMAEHKASWLKPEHYHCDEQQGVGLTLLHEEPGHTLAVFVVAWLPGRGVPPHNHGSWAVVAGIDGPETNTFWKRVDDGSRPGHAKLVKAGEKVFHEGEVLSMLPGAIHSITNRTQQITVSLHTYGMHLNFAERSQFDLERDEEKPFILDIQ